MSKRVCMIAYTNYTTDARVRREAETLVRHGHRVFFLSLSEGDRPRVYEINGVTVQELSVQKYRGRSSLHYISSYLRFLLLALLICTRRWVHGQVDVVHVHNMPDFLVLAAIFPRLLGKILILDVHDSMPETYTSKFGETRRVLFPALCLEESVCCRLAHRVICVNEIQRDLLLKRGLPEGKTTVLLNVPDDRIFHSNLGRPEGPEKGNGGPFRLIYHGTVEFSLGIDLAIRAVSKLRDEIPRLEFHILGTGADLTAMDTLSLELGTHERVHFSRKMYPVQELPALLKGMDLGIVPNRANRATDLMLPVKLLEYVALGIPVVTARLKTIQHYFTQEMVTFFEPGDVDSMVHAILSLYRDRDKADQQAMRARDFFETYGWEKHQRDLLRLYQEV